MRVTILIMTTEEVGPLLNLATIREESHPCNIVLLMTVGTTPNPRIQLTTFTSPPMIPIAVAYEMTTPALKTPVSVGRKFIRQKNQGILPRLEIGLNATSRLPTLQSTLGPPIKKGHLSSYSVKEEQIGGRKGRAGTGTMHTTMVGEQTTHGSQDTVVVLVANPMIGNVGISKMTVLNAIQKTGYGSLLRRGSHEVEGVAKAIAIRTTDGTRIGTGAAGAGKKVGITTNKDEISDLMIVI
jgi:hypothetical protein